MDLTSIKKNWEGFAKTDPFWAILTVKKYSGNKWEPIAFFATGENDVNGWFSEFTELKKCNTEKALDFGCGVGRLTQALCLRFAKVDGVDISETMIDLAKRHNNYLEKCQYFINDQPNLSIFPDKSYDLVCSHITLQHIPKDHIFNYIDEFIRITKPHGCILFSLPSKPPFWYQAATMLTPGVIKNMLRRVIFKSSYVMEVNWVNRKKVETHLKGKNLQVTTYQDSSTGKNWEGYFYLCTK